MNEYKRAWLSHQMIDYGQQRSFAKKGRKVAKDRKKGIDLVQLAAQQKAESTILAGAHEAFKYAAKSRVKGKLGIGLRVGGRVGLRLVPFVGAAMLAYDLYRLYDYMSD